MSLPTRMYGHEIVGGDLVHVPVHGEHVVMSVERDERDSRLLLDDGSTLLSRHGAFVTVVQPIEREYRRGRGRRHVSHIHFPNGTIADTAEHRLMPSLMLAALEDAGIDRRYLRVQTVQRRRELSLATHYVDPIKTDVTLCGIDRAETSDEIVDNGSGRIASCFTCQREARERVIGP